MWEAAMKIEVFEITSEEDKVYQELLEQYKSNPEVEMLLNENFIESEMILAGDFRLITMLKYAISIDNIRVYLVKDVVNEVFLGVIGKHLNNGKISLFPLKKEQSEELQLVIRSILVEKGLFELKKGKAPRIGLFWFSKDYTKIIRTEGEQYMSDEDLLKSERKDPIGLHADYDMPKYIPRGRINYENNIFRIWVGEDCWIEDENIINTIKNYFNLVKIDSTKFIVKRHYHWNINH